MPVQGCVCRTPPLTDDMEPDGTPVVRVHDYKTAYNPLIKAPTGISTIRGLLFKRGQIPLSRLSMTGDCRENVNILKRGVKLASLKVARREVQHAYRDFLPIKSAKLHDVQALLKHIHIPDSVTFYQHLTAIENVHDSGDEEDVEWIGSLVQ